MLNVQGHVIFSGLSRTPDTVFWDDLQILNSVMLQTCSSRSTDLSMPELSGTLKTLADFFSENLIRNELSDVVGN